MPFDTLPGRYFRPSVDNETLWRFQGMNGFADWAPHHRYIRFANGETISWGPSGGIMGSPGALNTGDAGGTCGNTQPSTPFMDEAMKDWARRHERDEYNVGFYNCRDFAEGAIRAGRGVP